MKTSVSHAVALVLISLTASAQVSSSQIDSIFSAMKSTDAPGAAVLVVQHGKAVFRRGYGVTDPRSRRAIDAETNFRLASVTKQFTAMCIMLLVHDGKLHYDDHLTDVFPKFPAYGKSITVRNLLNHTSGLVDYEDLWMKAHPDSKESGRKKKIPQIHDADVLKLMEQQPQGEFAPGTKWEYSNTGYVVLGQIVEKVSGKRFGDFLHERIFAPLMMNHTVAYEKGKNVVSHRAYGHTRQPDGTWLETDQSPTSATLGDGGIYTSIDDLAKWDLALRNHTLLSAAEMQPALTPVQPSSGPALSPDGQPVSYGFGWNVNPWNGRKRMHHNGETTGFRTTIQRFPDDDLTVVVLANRVDLDVEQLALQTAEIFLAK